ncbi:MAG TPA: hypothetical protein VHM24_08040 [Gemmatimonadaceae bacterium]|nr:hypothetical protein [Gemmatimonadaceae bacterium]
MTEVEMGTARDPSNRPPRASGTSGSREESIDHAGDDAFDDGDKKRSAVPSSSDPDSSGTTPLGGEPAGGNARPGPGGVEGESGSS